MVLFGTKITVYCRIAPKIACKLSTSSVAIIRLCMVFQKAAQAGLRMMKFILEIAQVP
jgi:hypothetical protein